MIPRSPAPFLVACVLASAVCCSASKLDDLEYPSNEPFQVDPYFQDSLEVATKFGGSDLMIERWVVHARDANGRPLRTTLESSDPTRPEAGKTTVTNTFEWGLPVELPLARQPRSFDTPHMFVGCTSWPSSLKTEFMQGDSSVLRAYYRTTWNPLDRSLTLRGDSSWFQGVTFATPGAPWVDSIVFDEQDRTIHVIKHITITVGGAQIHTTKSRRIHFENALDLRPRWTSEHSEDIGDVVDSVTYVGLVGRPTHAIHVRRLGGHLDSSFRVRIDTLEWGAEARLVSWSFVLGSSPDSMARISSRTTWEGSKITRWIWQIANADTTETLMEKSFTYGGAGTGTSSRSTRLFGLRRTSRGLVGVPRNSTAPPRVEWVSLEGRRQPLRIITTSESSLTVAAPHGFGVLRVIQGHDVRNYSLTGF